MRIAFLTGHAADSHRRTGLHFWMDILAARGVDVDWVTLGFSRLTCLKQKNAPYKGPYNRWTELSPRVQKFVWCPLFHPINLGAGWLNLLAVPFFNLYTRLIPPSLLERLKNADIVIVEVGAGLMLIPTLAKQSPATKFIYFAADRPRAVGAHPAILAAEQKALPYFSLIRVPAEIMKNDYPTNLPVRYIPQGLSKEAFGQSVPNPYPKPKNVISIGDMSFDAAPLETMARNFPDWSFHLFGKQARLGKAYPNVVEYGERPFESLIPYIQHADIALAPYLPMKDGDYIAQSSLKIIQYTYCRLPVVAPDFIPLGRPYIKGYNRNNKDSIIAAFEGAMAVDRADIETSAILGWNDVLNQMLS